MKRAQAKRPTDGPLDREEASKGPHAEPRSGRQGRRLEAQPPRPQRERSARRCAPDLLSEGHLPGRALGDARPGFSARVQPAGRRPPDTRPFPEFRPLRADEWKARRKRLRDEPPKPTEARILRAARRTAEGPPGIAGTRTAPGETAAADVRTSFARRPFPPGPVRWGTRRPGCVNRPRVVTRTRGDPYGAAVRRSGEMSFIVAHAAHAWLEVALFAPAGAVVVAAILRPRRRGARGATETKENP